MYYNRIVPGNPTKKLRKVDGLVEWFNEWATDFDEALPGCYKYTGTTNGKDRRADAWALADKHAILLRDALGELQAVLRSRVVSKSTVDRGTKRYSVKSVTD